jgi:hypothetical protein
MMLCLCPLVFYVVSGHQNDHAALPLLSLPPCARAHRGTNGLGPMGWHGHAPNKAQPAQHEAHSASVARARS